MANSEAVEKVRQEIMRFRELLDLTQQKLDDADRAYVRLFADLSSEQYRGMKDKDLQTELARQMVDDVTPLANAVMQARYDIREMYKSFSELSDIIATPPIED